MPVPGFSGFWPGGYDPDPDFLPHWQSAPMETPATEPEVTAPAVGEGSVVVPLLDKALAEFEQLLHEYDQKTSVGELLEQLDRQLGRLRPGGSWTSGETEAVKVLLLVAARLRRKLA